MVKTVYFRVKGRVQGVFFRASTLSAAKQFGVTGWVKNRQDGDVEGRATGEDDSLFQFKNWLSHGPELATVDGVEIEDVDFEKFDNFEIR